MKEPDLMPEPQSAVGRRLSLEEFLKLPEEKPYLELVDGVVRQKAWAGGQHSVLQGEFSRVLADHAEPSERMCVFIELDTGVGPDVLLPDVSAFRWERVPTTPDGLIADVRLAEPPDIAIEIRSPE